MNIKPHCRHFGQTRIKTFMQKFVTANVFKLHECIYLRNTI